MKQTLFALLSCFLLASCEKREIPVDAVDFDVSTDRVSYNLGDTVVFHFSGDSPDIMTFYSGEGASDYAYLSEDKYIDGNVSLSFQSAKFSGTNEDCARLKYSTDFSGVYEEDEIRAATWTDISDRFTIPPIVGTGPTFTFSGAPDITDLFADRETPVYFGWFYTIKDRTANSDERRTRFRVQNFDLRTFTPQVPDLFNVVYDFVGVDFQLVTSASYDLSPPAGGVAVGERPRFVDNTTNSLVFDGPFTNDVFREAWAITKPLYAPDKMNLGHAVGVGIKAFNTSVLDTYRHVFNSSGVYTVTFVGKNVNIYNRTEAVRQIEVVINE